MKKIKVYNEHGQFIDSVSLMGVPFLAAITELNKNGRYIKRQFNAAMTKLTHSYADFKPVHNFKVDNPAKEPTNESERINNEATEAST